MSRTIHRLSIGIAALITALVVMAPVAADADEFRIEGSGWGHGVGFSQYGAQHMAGEGWTAEEIVEYYYSGSEVKPLADLPSTWMDSDPEPLWIGLDRNDASQAFSLVDGPGTACHSDVEPCPQSAAHSIAAGESWTFAYASGSCQFHKDGQPVGSPGTCNASVSWDGTQGTRLSLPSRGDSYAWGDLMFRSYDPAQIHTVLRIGLEDFLKGVGEAILSWHSEALEAQVLASRTHAVYSALQDGPESGFSNSIKDYCWCHLRSGVDQAYDGWSIESYPQGFGQRWVDAVTATTGDVITHSDSSSTENGVIFATFYSSSGGTTAANQEVWNGAPIPYLQSVADPWSLGPQNPKADWTTWKTASSIASWVGLDSISRIYVASRFSSGSANEVRFDGYDNGVWKQITKTGQQVRTGLGLYSTWISTCRERGPFSDDGCSFFEHNIVNIANAGYTDGYGNGTYGPSHSMTRAAMAEFLARGLGLPGSAIDHFPDDDGIPEEGWINSLADAGITVGYDDGTYRPYNTVNRAEMAVYLARGMGAFSPPVPGSDPFPDVPRTSWFGPSVAHIVGEGVTYGYEDGTYGPWNITTREQMAAFIDRALLGGH